MHQSVFFSVSRFLSSIVFYSFFSVFLFQDDKKIRTEWKNRNKPKKYFFFLKVKKYVEKSCGDNKTKTKSYFMYFSLFYISRIRNIKRRTGFEIGLSDFWDFFKKKFRLKKRVLKGNFMKNSILRELDLNS